MARDLRFAALPDNPASADLQLVINPPNLGNGYKLPQAAFWQAPVASDRSRGNMALVGYFVQWVNEANGAPANMVPKLCRLVADSDYEMQKPSDFVTDQLVAVTPRREGFGLCRATSRKCAGLWMQPLDQQNKPISSDAKAQPIAAGQFDSSKGYTVLFANGVVTKYPSALPASLEVALVAVDARTAKRLTGSEKPKARTLDMWADVNAFYNSLPPTIKQGARIYSTVIDLHGAPAKNHEASEKECRETFGLRPDHDVGHRGADHGGRRGISGQCDAGIEDRRFEPRSGTGL